MINYLKEAMNFKGFFCLVVLLFVCFFFYN